MPTIGEQITEKALEVLDGIPEGVRYSDLVRRIIEIDGSFKQNTVHGTVWNLDERFPDRIYKPSRGLFRLTKYRATDTDQLKEELVPKQPKKIKEVDFYEPFADWLVNGGRKRGRESFLEFSSARKTPDPFLPYG